MPIAHNAIKQYCIWKDLIHYYWQIKLSLSSALFCGGLVMYNRYDLLRDFVLRQSIHTYSDIIPISKIKDIGL